MIRIQKKTWQWSKILICLSRISSSFQKKCLIDVRTYYIHTCNNIKQWAQTHFKVAFKLHKKLPNLLTFYTLCIFRISSSFQKKCLLTSEHTYYIHTCNNIKQWVQTRFKVAFELHKKLLNLLTFYTLCSENIL